MKAKNTNKFSRSWIATPHHKFEKGNHQKSGTQLSQDSQINITDLGNDYMRISISNKKHL